MRKIRSALGILLVVGLAALASGRAEAETGKKGYCLPPKKTPDWPARLEALGAHWFYIWTAHPPKGVPEGVEFVPMMFGTKPWTKNSIAYIDGAKTREGFRFVLGFNEPDREKQADMSVEEALALWPKLMTLDLPLVSPAAAKPDGEWMRRFMKGVEQKGYRVDAVAVHWYGNPNPEQFLRMLERVHKLYDRPIWITEFAVADWQAESLADNRWSERDVTRFLREVLPELERRDYIHRYAWFCASPNDAQLGRSALFDGGGGLTAAGRIYAE